MIKIIKITKSYQTYRALDDVSLDINEGDFLAITGPAGSGKSTLLALIAGILSPSRGRVVYEIRHPRQGLSFQEPIVLPYLSLFHNVVFASRSLIRRKKWHDWVLGWLSRFHLPHNPFKRASYLSGGESRVLSVLRAFYGHPPLVLLDEPTGHLDDERAFIVLELMKEYLTQKRTLVYVTHEKKLAGKARAILHMDHGKVIDYSQRRTSKL